MITILDVPWVRFFASAAAQEGQEGLPWWAWVLIVLAIILLLFLLWWLLGRSKKAATPAEPVSPAYTAPAPAGPEAVTPVKPDDLKVIEGIGPKISGLLQAAGLATFRQLAEADPQRLQQILDEADLRLADPGTWKEQAKLAADGKWDELQALQDSLKGGRRE